MLFFLSFGLLVNGFWMEVLVTIPYSLSIFFPSPPLEVIMGIWNATLSIWVQDKIGEWKVHGRTRCWRNLEVWTHQEKKSQNRNGMHSFSFPLSSEKVSRNWVVTWTFFGKTSRPKIKLERGPKKKKNQNRVEPGFELERGLKRKKYYVRRYDIQKVTLVLIFHIHRMFIKF